MVDLTLLIALKQKGLLGFFRKTQKTISCDFDNYSSKYKRLTLLWYEIVFN